MNGRRIKVDMSGVISDNNYKCQWLFLENTDRTLLSVQDVINRYIYFYQARVLVTFRITQCAFFAKFRKNPSPF